MTPKTTNPFKSAHRRIMLLLVVPVVGLVFGPLFHFIGWSDVEYVPGSTIPLVVTR